MTMKVSRIAEIALVLFLWLVSAAAIGVACRIMVEVFLTGWRLLD